MPLEMREKCEKCEAGLMHEGEAFICSYECTFCGPCTTTMDHTCPNCGGELLRRPHRAPRD
jgi:hypothetical protein